MKRKFINGLIITGLSLTLLTGQTVFAQELIERQESVSSNTIKEVEESDVDKEIKDIKEELKQIKKEIKELKKEKEKQETAKKKETTKKKETVKKSEESEDLIKVGTVLYSKTTLNVRAGKSTSSKSIGKLYKGDSFKVVKDTGKGWIQLNYKDKKGYVCADYVTASKIEKPKTTMVKVDSSAYCDKGRSASGRALKSGYSLAGRVSWLGKTVKVYECKSNGSVGALKGTYRFDDTGYGKSTGSGASRILKGKSIGTIENGTCVDFFMNTRSECINWGRRPVYIEFVN